mgnify:FL=1|jgi:putative Holliday junction resolvase
MLGRVRRLGIDLGDRRIGLAVSIDGSSPVGLSTLKRSASIEGDLVRLSTLCREQRITDLAIGIPLHSDGTMSTQGEKTLRWAEQVARELRLPVVYVDERYSSERAAERVGRQGGGSGGAPPGPTRREAHRAALDQAAAKLILEDAQEEALRLDPAALAPNSVP